MPARDVGQRKTKPGAPNKMKNGSPEHHSPPGLQGRGGSHRGAGEKSQLEGPEGRSPGGNKSASPALPPEPIGMHTESHHKAAKLTKLGNWNLGVFQTLERRPAKHSGWSQLEPK